MTSHRIIAAAAALAFAATPAALAKKPDGAGAKGKAKQEETSKAKQEEGKGKGKAKGKSKAKNVVAHGTITAIDGDSVTIAVTKANKHGRGLTELTITVQKVSVADVNGDGAATLADFAAGDRVVAHSKGGKLISVTNPEPEEDAEDETEAAPAPVAPAG